MKIAVFGASGTVGRYVLEQAVDAGHEVTAFARSPEKLGQIVQQIRVVQGDVLEDNEAIMAAVEGQDAVIVVLGAGAKGRVRAEGTRRIIDAMRRCGVRNLICQSTLGAGSSASMLNFKWRWLFRIPLRWAMADHERQEALVRASGLDWTIVRPGAFTDGPLTGEYQHGAKLAAPLSLEVSRKDVAHFLLGEASQPAYRSQAVALSY